MFELFLLLWFVRLPINLNDEFIIQFLFYLSHAIPSGKICIIITAYYSFALLIIINLLLMRYFKTVVSLLIFLTFSYLFKIRKRALARKEKSN